MNTGHGPLIHRSCTKAPRSSPALLHETRLCWTRIFFFFLLRPLLSRPSYVVVLGRGPARFFLKPPSSLRLSAKKRGQEYRGILRSRCLALTDGRARGGMGGAKSLENTPTPEGAIDEMLIDCDCRGCLDPSGAFTASLRCLLAHRWSYREQRLHDKAGETTNAPGE